MCRSRPSWRKTSIVPLERERVFVDTNIFVYAATRSHVQGGEGAALQAGSQAVIQALADGHFIGVTRLTVLQEILYLLTRWARQRDEPGLYDTGRQIVRSAVSLVEETLAPTVLEFSRAVEGYRPGEDFNDLLIVETMRARGITTILTTDRGFEELGVERLDPRDWHWGRAGKG